MKLFWRAICLCVFALPISRASAGSLYVHVPGINGEQSVPGFANAMNVNSLTISPLQFSFIKPIDGASPQLFQAAALGTPLSATALVYDGAPSLVPDGTIPFPATLISSYQLQGQNEEVAFSTNNPGSLFLELPGIIGAQTTPGHPNVMRLNLVTLTATEFTIVKPVDDASAPIVLASLQGINFAEARLLFYNSANPGGPPQQVFNFSTILISSYQNLGGDPAIEEVTFSFTHVPEPATVSTIFGAGAALLLRRRSKRAECAH